MDTWYQANEAGELDEEILAQIASLWPGALDLEEHALIMCLNSARVQCEAYAPQHQTVTDNYRHAQILQARALAKAGVVGNDGEIYAGEATVTLFPMDWTVKRLLNPERRIGGLA